MSDSPDYFSDFEMLAEEDLMNIPSLRPTSPSFSSQASIMDSAMKTSGNNMFLLRDPVADRYIDPNKDTNPGMYLRWLIMLPFRCIFFPDQSAGFSDSQSEAQPRQICVSFIPLI